MSPRLFVTRVLDRAKSLKKWYAKVVPADMTLSELFSQLRDGEVDGIPLDAKYIGCQVYIQLRCIFCFVFNVYLFSYSKSIHVIS